MKMRLVALVGLAISFALPVFAQEQNTVDAEVRQQIEAALTNFDEAFNKNDAAAIADESGAGLRGETPLQRSLDLYVLVDL